MDRCIRRSATRGREWSRRMMTCGVLPTSSTPASASLFSSAPARSARVTQFHAWRQRVETLIAESRRELEEHAHADASPLNPELLFWELNKLLPTNTILTADCGSSTVWYARYLKIQRGMMATLSGTLATMGSAVP